MTFKSFVLIFLWNIFNYGMDLLQIGYKKLVHLPTVHIKNSNYILIFRDFDNNLISLTINIIFLRSFKCRRL